MPSQVEVETFIVRCFRSVWALDLAQFLLANSGKYYSHEELIDMLRASRAVVAQSVASLAAAGLVQIDGDRVSLLRRSDQSTALLQAAIDLYRKSPDKVRRLIIAAASPGLTAFANAFRIRKD